MNRVVVWFSCGAASAVAASMAVAKYGAACEVVETIVWLAAAPLVRLLV